MIVGVLTALVVVFSQLFLYQGADFCKKEEIRTEKQNQESSEDQETFISLPSSTILSSFHKEVSHEAAVLFEISFNEEKPLFCSPEVAFSLGKYFHTLFHIIISPNAP